MVMVKGGIIKTILIFVTLFLVCSLVWDSNARTKDILTYNDLGSVYFYPQNNLTVPFYSYSRPAREATKQPPKSNFTCPEDISTYTDINTCNAFISGNLNPVFDEKTVARLTWEMTGATTGASPSQGIHLITDYTFEEGTTVVTYTATETDGSTTSCSFTVTISDNQVPRLENMPANITVSADESECFARVTWNEPTGADNCTPAGEILLEKSNNLGSRFPVGVTTISYRAYDAMGNTSVERSFTVTVEDREPPFFQLPEDKTIDCGTEIPPPWPSLQQVVAEGGYATDNCAIQPNSFRLSSETASAESCPYILTRIYQIADIHGNTATAQHLVVVEGEGPETKTKEEVVPLKSGMVDYTAAQSGPWSNPATWGDSGPPVSGDNVTIPSGITVTVDGLSACNNIVLNGGLNHSGATTLQVYGNWTNNGTYTGGTGTIEFTGSNLATIGGSSTTTFEKFILDKTPNTNVVGVTGNVQIDGDLTTDVLFTSGLLEIGSGGNINFIGNAGFTIGENAGIVISGGIFSTGDFSIDNKGLIQIDSGTLTFGTSSGNSVVIRSSGTLDINGGTVNVAGRLEVSGGTADISGGTINLNTKGNGSSSIATLDLSSTSVFNMTGGTINFENPTGLNGYDIIIENSSGSKTFGGTINFGDGTSQTYKITSQIPFPGFNVASNTNIILEMLVSSNGTYNFPLVDGAGNSIPASITISGSGYLNASIQVETIGTKFSPENKSSTNFLNRYWTVTTSGITDPVYNVTTTYTPTDIAGTESEIAAGLWTGSLPWEKDSPANTSANTITFSGITSTSADITGITLDPPTVEINNGKASETICNGFSITLNTTVTGDPTFSYLWEPTTDLDLTDSANPVADPATTATYAVTVTDGNGFTATDDIIITVNPIPNITAAPESQTICSGETTNIVLSSNVPGTTFNWTVVQSGVSGATNYNGSTIAQILTATGSTPGTATYTITPTANGCDGAPVTVTVTVNTPPAFTTCPATPITITTDAGLCTAIASYTVTATGTPAPTYSYQFSGATSGSGNGTGSGSTFGVGTTTVTVTATNSCGDANCVFTVVVTDNQPPVITCPANINVNNSPGYCYATPAIVNLIYATATDNCNPAPTVSGVRSDGQPLNTNYPVGTTTITWTANDGSNTSTCTQTVTVVDSEAPTFTAPVNITLYADATCSVNRSPSITGNVINPKDNCTPPISLVAAYTDGPDIPGACAGTYSFVRTWTVTDLAGNYTPVTQTISVIDNIKPVLYLPPSVSVACDDSNLPASTGYATASDNCETVVTNITYRDSIVAGTCVTRSTLYRIWKATDPCGNERTGIQTINISDTEGPVVTMPDLSATCPSTISPIYETMEDFINDGGTAIDLCGAVTIEIIFENEISYGLEDKPGYCPDYLERTYRFTDPCGNYVDEIQTITVQGECGCDPCDANTEFSWVDFLGNPEGDTTFVNVERFGKCCPEAEYWQKPGNNPFRCVSYNVRIDEDAVGVQISIDAGAKPEVKEWLVDCENVSLVGPGSDIICLPSGGFHLFTFCKQGGNANNISFRSVPGIVASDDITTRVECGTQITTEGDFTDPQWTSVSPGNRGDWDHYLDLTDPFNPIFIADENAPVVIEYEVCGTFPNYVCSATGKNCDTISVYVYEAINIDLNINPDVVCADNIPTITPDISPAVNYELDWYSGLPGTGTLLCSNCPSYKPLNDGLYYLVVTDVREGIPCSTDTFDFEIIYDHTGPTVQEPPAPLQIQCNDPNAAQLIQNWLNSASANYVNASGDTVAIVPHNDYTGISMTCGDTVTVAFTAFDQCSNDSTRISYISVIDTVQPVITFCPPATDNIADHDSCSITILDVGVPLFSDDCDTPILSWIKTGATLGSGTGQATGPFNVGVTTVTYTVTDECGNTATCAQEITIFDEQPPDILVCPEDVTFTAPPPGCELVVTEIDSLKYEDNCNGGSSSVTWVKTGATEGSGSGDINGTTFNAGITTVTYTVTDAYGNTSECSFTVTINDTIPPTIIDCPDDVTAYVTAGNCDAYVTVPGPDVEDPCGKIFTIHHNSPFTGANDTIASGTYPVG